MIFRRTRTIFAIVVREMGTPKMPEGIYQLGHRLMWASAADWELGDPELMSEEELGAATNAARAKRPLWKKAAERAGDLLMTIHSKGNLMLLRWWQWVVPVHMR